MARLLTHKDGRLRTGRVTAVLFTLLIICVAVLFELKKPMTQAMVSVKHVFEPKTEQSGKPVKKTVRKIEPLKKNSQASNRKSPEKPKVENTAKPVQLQKLKKAEKPSSRPIVAKTDAQNTAQKAKPVQTDKKSPGKPVTVRTVQTRKNEANRKKPTAKPQEAIQLDISGKLKAIHSWGKPVQKKKRTDLSENIRKLQAENKVAQSSRPPVVNKEPVSVNKSERSITVAPEDYQKLFQHWRTAAADKGSGKDDIVPLRVENLKEAHDLFQMKPVAIVDNRFFYDLTDGTRIPPDSLEEYAGTVFRVNDPWDKWSEGLSAAGIKESDTFKVRYYMYGFIKNAIYSRANRAIFWCKQTGRLSADTSLSSVDVLGRAFVIRQQGGGRFGVFVPVSVNTGDGQTIAIDPECFADQPDVRALQTAGLI